MPCDARRSALLCDGVRAEGCAVPRCCAVPHAASPQRLRVARRRFVAPGVDASVCWPFRDGLLASRHRLYLFEAFPLTPMPPLATPFWIEICKILHRFSSCAVDSARFGRYLRQNRRFQNPSKIFVYFCPGVLSVNFVRSTAQLKKRCSKVVMLLHYPEKRGRTPLFREVSRARRAPNRKERR